MVRKRVKFGEFEVPIPKGHQRITDKDETTDYLFINAPKEIYTVYFDSGMPFYSDKILSGFPEGGTLELKLPDIGKLSSVMGTMYDKRALARGEPTENVGGVIKFEDL